MLFVLLFVLLVFMYNMVGLVEIANETSKKTEVTLKQFDALNKREESLKSINETLTTDQGQEEALRDKYHLVKAGERMVVIVDQEDSASSPTPAQEQKKGFFGFFKNLSR